MEPDLHLPSFSGIEESLDDSACIAPAFLIRKIGWLFLEF
jgi:hypothetical protein